MENIKEIVTAVCYKPDGKFYLSHFSISNLIFKRAISPLLQGAIAGTILGNCHFYDIKGTLNFLVDQNLRMFFLVLIPLNSDNHLHLDTVVCLEGKRSLSRRINSFQFSPCDSSKVTVTSGDSQVRILSGVGVVCKLKGLRNGRKHMSASFTADGNYIVSASADSNVYIWNCSSTIGSNFCYSSSNEMSSCENFVSENALIAVPWYGYRDASNGLRHHFSVKELESLTSRLSDMVLPSVDEVHMFKDVCHRMVHSDMWGLVIVTGGSDGRIRAYHNYGLPVKT
ncbi:hypothetical protein V2J09_020116 [Rumex salicifolius]